MRSNGTGSNNCWAQSRSSLLPVNSHSSLVVRFSSLLPRKKACRLGSKGYQGKAVIDPRRGISRSLEGSVHDIQKPEPGWDFVLLLFFFFLSVPSLSLWIFCGYITSHPRTQQFQAMSIYSLFSGSGTWVTHN